MVNYSDLLQSILNGFQCLRSVEKYQFEFTIEFITWIVEACGRTAIGRTPPSIQAYPNNSYRLYLSMSEVPTLESDRTIRKPIVCHINTLPLMHMGLTKGP